MENKYFYNRKLPHWQPPEETFFITYRLAGSLPMSLLRQMKEDYHLKKNLPDNQLPGQKEILRQEYYELIERKLDNNPNEPHWLRHEAIASIVLNSLLFNNNKQYTLWCACLMSNHVHILLSTIPGSPLLHVILQNHKKFTAVQGNKALERTGPFWAEESFDTLIRDNQHFYRTVNYIVLNPVKAGLVEKWIDWKWTYLHPELEKDYQLRAKEAW